jgi:transcription initiation factor TFIIIB Brf1 subunit/transcription initiation factor TFIIB
MKQGTCPNCGSMEIEYHDYEMYDTQLMYEATCAKCMCEFKEWYNLNFVTQTIYSEELFSKEAKNE